jgi:hypothetical protein
LVLIIVHFRLVFFFFLLLWNWKCLWHWLGSSFLLFILFTQFWVFSI